MILPDNTRRLYLNGKLHQCVDDILSAVTLHICVISFEHHFHLRGQSGTELPREGIKSTLIFSFIALRTKNDYN